MSKMVFINNKAHFVPTSWDSVTFGNFLAIVQKRKELLSSERESTKTLTSILTGEQFEEFETNFDELNEAFSFLHSPPEIPLILCFALCGNETVRVPLNITLDPKSELYKSLMQRFVKKKSDIDEAYDMPYYCACWLQTEIDGVFHEQAAIEMIPDVLRMEFTEVFSLCVNITNDLKRHIKKDYASFYHRLFQNIN